MIDAADPTMIGISGDHGQDMQKTASITGGDADSYAYEQDGTKVNNSVYTAYGDSYATLDIIGMIVDLDNGKIWWSNNGVIQIDGNPVNGTGFGFDNLLTNALYTAGAHYFPAVHIRHDSDTGTYHFNFGQGDPDGENNFTDSNGRGGFRYEPPSGFVSLCTANMKDADYASIGPTATTTSDQHFDTVLWNGTELEQRIGGLNFQPDLVWIKSRTNADSHQWYDSLRGVTRALHTDTAVAEEVIAQGLTSFNADGFTVGTDINHNESGDAHVAWCWKAGNGSVEDNSGDIPVTRSTNVDAGFSIVSYTGTGSAATLGHGLSSAPEMIIVKRTDAGTGGWYVYHERLDASAPEDKYLQLQDAAAVADATWTWNDTAPTSSVFSIGSDTGISGSNMTYIAYCFHSVEGFSKFGSYVGNGDVDGPFVYLGFKPRLVIIKNIDVVSEALCHWFMFDSARDPFNVKYNRLWADSDQEENDSSFGPNTTNSMIDFLSNGFKIRTTASTGWHTAAKTYIYMAWAEMPFKYATAG